MSLKFNTFRADRYIRTKFVEGRYLLAEENSDLELELLDYLRKSLKNNIGNIAVQDAWKVSKYSTTQLLVSPGEAWQQGLLFELRAGNDWLLTAGTVPSGVTISDEPSGLGKLVTFTNSTTPSLDYRIVITASEEVIDSTEDPFLQNVNVPEPTATKVRLVYSINVVSASNQGVAPNYDTSSPIPYQGEVGAASIVNLSNTIKVTPNGTSGYLVSLVPITNSQQIDGRSAELVIKNPTGVNPIPSGSTDQAQFENGTLIDTLGNEYHINAIFNDVVSNQVRIRVSYEVGQSAPVIPGIGGPFSPYYIKKQDVYYGDDTTGTPTGKLHWHIAEANWNTTSGFVHSSSITDIRTRVISETAFEELTNNKFVLKLTGGRYISLGTDGQTLTWTSDFELVNPSGPIQSILASNAVLVEGGTLTYTLNPVSGGVISLGNLSVTVSSNSGTTVNFSGSPSLASVRIGNVLKIGNQNSYITAIDDVNKNVVVASALTNTGSATIYLDSFGPGTVNLNEDTYTLAVFLNGKAVIDNVLTLGAGESNAVYDERIQYPTGLLANTNITLPTNSITGLSQFYDATNKKLLVFVNQLLKFQAVDWIAVDPQTIQFNYALSNDSEVHFRIETFPAGTIGTGGGSGTESLQQAYNNGNTITIASGIPVTINGPSGQKLLTVNGDVDITGVIDPSGIQLSPQSSNPLSGSQAGIWVDNSGALQHTDGTTETNITQVINNVISGTAQTTISNTYDNNSGATIAAFAPVYSPTSGQIDLADGTNSNKYQIIGITTESILNGNMGVVAFSGYVQGVTGLTHGLYVYLGLSPGTLTSTPPSLGSYPSGFNVIKIGTMEGTNLILQIQHMGTL